MASTISKFFYARLAIGDWLNYFVVVRSFVSIVEIPNLFSFKA
jgi:hypothetical protein